MHFLERNMREVVSTITTKGQVTIPQAIRERFGFLPHTEIEFVVEGNCVILRKKQNGSSQGMKSATIPTGIRALFTSCLSLTQKYS